MKGITIVLAVGALLLGIFVYQRHHLAGMTGPTVHVRNEFEFTVHAPYTITAPLFGPEGERGWAGAEWDPHFLYPQPAADKQGAVFTVHHGHHRSYWINTALDLEGRHFQYVYVIPEVMATLIDVRFSELDSENTKVNVAYERTALNPAANEHVREAGRSDSNQGAEWGKAVNDYLAKQNSQRIEPGVKTPPSGTGR
jgi:hypothetical protein